MRRSVMRQSCEGGTRIGIRVMVRARPGWCIRPDGFPPGESGNGNAAARPVNESVEKTEASRGEREAKAHEVAKPTKKTAANEPPAK